MPIYSYAELKGKIKVGDRVRAVVGRENGCAEFGEMLAIANTNSKVCKITDIGADRFRINGCGHGYHEDVFLELLTEEKTLDTVDVGDVVVDGDGRERTILDTSKNGTVLFLSSAASGDWSGVMATRQELKLFDYTVKQPTLAPEPKEMTLEEVSKALGYPVKIVE